MIKKNSLFLLLSSVLFACGPDALKVPDGQKCTSNQDCRSGLCVQRNIDKICVPQTCNNGIQDGNEADLDCGAVCNVGCVAGQRCFQDNDCKYGRCYNGSCVPDICTNNQQDWGETDDDCGGICPPCNMGKTCENNGDCQSDCCAIKGNTCVTPQTDRANCL